MGQNIAPNVFQNKIEIQIATFTAFGDHSFSLQYITFTIYTFLKLVYIKLQHWQDDLRTEDQYLGNWREYHMTFKLKKGNETIYNLMP